MTSTDLALTADQEADLARAATADLGDDAPTLPLISVVQGLSKAHTQRDVPTGNFVNTLTDKDYGNELGLVVVYATVGRFLPGQKSPDGNTYVAFGDTAPSNWPEAYAGTRFDAIPDAEETWREAANAEGGSWGSGPPIQTTKNFIGFVVEDPEIPVRLSLKSTSMPAARKIEALLRWTFKAPWHNVIDLTTRATENSQGQPYHVVQATQGRPTTDEEQAAGVQLHQLISGALGSLRLVGDAEAVAKARPERDPDALSVG
jgi:hypothetical protein